MKDDVYLIRMANIEDITHLICLRSLLLENSEKSYASRNARSSKAWKTAYEIWLKKVLTTNLDIFILVAEVDKKVVGAITGIIDHRAPACDCLSGLCGWIQSLAVNPFFRQKGIAHQLVSDLLSLFNKHNVYKILLETTNEAKSLYKTIGFTFSQENLLIFNTKD